MTQAEHTDTRSDETGPTVRITRSVPAPPDTVWRAFTDSGALGAWFWPSRLSPKVETDPRVGGRFRITSSLARTAASAIGGEYLAVEPPEKLVFTWCWEGDDTTSQVTVLLCKSEDGTELTIQHEKLLDEEDRDAQARGWRDCLDRLPDWLQAAGQG